MSAGKNGRGRRSHIIGSTNSPTRAAGRAKHRALHPLPVGAPSLRAQILDPDTASRVQARARFFDPAKKTRIGFEPIFEPVVVRSEADQHAGRLAVARDGDFLFPGLA